MLNLAAAAAAGALADQAIAAMSLVSKVFMMVFSIMLGIGQGFQPVMGYNYGARRFDRAREAFWFLAKSCTVIMTVFGILGFFFAENLIGVFGSAKSDLDVLRIGTRNGAKLMNLNHLGVLEAGREASFLTLEKSPIDDMNNICGPKKVYIKGERTV